LSHCDICIHLYAVNRTEAYIYQVKKWDTEEVNIGKVLPSLKTPLRSSPYRVHFQMVATLHHAKLLTPIL